jgi:hypothetical protein
MIKIGLVFGLLGTALSWPAFAQVAQSRIPSADTPSCSTIRNVEERLVCMEKRIDEMTDMLGKGFLLADTGQVSNNQCIGIQIDTATSPIMVPCSPNSRLQTWTIKKTP